MAAALYQLPFWLLTISMIVGANPQPPGPFQNILPRPLIHMKIGLGGEMITSPKGRSSWLSIYSSDTTTPTADEPTTPAPVVAVNGSTLPPYDTIVRLRFSSPQYIPTSLLIRLTKPTVLFQSTNRSQQYHQ